MSFAADLQKFTEKVERRTHDAFVRTTQEVHRSVVEGSELTGAPGQPVDTGNLKSSWRPKFLTRWLWQTTTKVEYAPIIEDNLRGATLRSEVGGFHSVALTRAGFQNIVDAVVTEVRQ